MATANRDNADQVEGEAIVPANTSTAMVALPQRERGEGAIDFAIRLMEMLPPPSEDVIEAIAERILAAPNEYEQNRLWEASSSKDLVGKRFIFHGVTIQESDYRDDPDNVWPYYLVCHVTDVRTGEKTVLTTGSTNMIMALLPAALLGRLPWEAEIVGPRRPTKKGNQPLHIRWVAKVVSDDD